MAADEPLRIIVHLGAHKTASTHLQQALGRARTALAARGVALFLPEDLRRDGLRLTGCIAAPREDGGHAAMIRNAFAEAARGARALLISEENILGTAHNPAMIAREQFYPEAQARLARLAALLPSGEVTMALALRDPAGFLVSAYSQRLLAGTIESFEDFRGGLDPASLSWADLVARLQGAMPQSRMLLWRYEDYPGIAGPALTAMLGEEAARQVQPGAGRAHQGLSAPAHEALMEEAAALSSAGRDVARARVQALRRRFGRDKGHPPLALLDEAASARAAAAYAREVAQLAAQPGMRLLAEG